MRSTLLCSIGVFAAACSTPAKPTESRTAILAEPAQSPPSAADTLEPLQPAVPIGVDLNNADALAVTEAERLLDSGQVQAALARVEDVSTAAAQLIRARGLRMAGKLKAAEDTLKNLNSPTAMRPWVSLENARIAQAQADDEAALARLEEGFIASEAMARATSLPLAELRARLAPADLMRDRLAHEQALDPKDIDARSRLLGLLETSATKLPNPPMSAEALAVQRYLEEPVSGETPELSPRPLTLDEKLTRAESLLDAHRNERVLEELAGLLEEPMPTSMQCRLHFIYGMAARKLRLYSKARSSLGRVAKAECDADLKRRAHYLWAKVISIAGGLAAIEPIEDFADRYAGHSMVDDTLFWAGDMYQRRGKRTRAEHYYRRIEGMTPIGDHCAIARWRLAWMSYRAGDSNTRTRLERLLEDDGCVQDAFERARATYWLARLDQTKGEMDRAIREFVRTTEVDPLGFYAQLALARLEQLSPTDFASVNARHRAPSPGSKVELCPGALARDPKFLRGYSLYRLGLHNEAAAEWLTIDVESTDVVSSAHASALAKEAKAPTENSQVSAERCQANTGGLLLAILLSRVGEKAEAQWRLRTRYAALFGRLPTKDTEAIWIAAYPLEARDSIEPAEIEHGLPPFFLQALSREESAFDAQIVSWAGAYGLTQLLLSTGQSAGRLLKPPVKVTRAEELLEPKLNARLGAAYLRSLLDRFGGHPALALAAYNAGERVAGIWSRRHAGDDLDLYGEEMTIKETRGYVKRVLRTFGIYRWIYAGAPPVVPAKLVLPGKKSD